MDQALAEIRKIPAVTRFLCASALAVSVPVMLDLVSPYHIVFLKQFVFSKLQIWRIYTSFFFGSGINFLFDFVMLYQNSSQIEPVYYARRSADYAWQLLLASGAILLFNVPLQSVVHFRPLVLALTYLASALAPPGSQCCLMGLATLPVAYLPYIMLVMDLVVGGPKAAARAASGLAVGHLWWWAIHGSPRGRRAVFENMGRAPGWMRWIVGEGAARTGGGGSESSVGGVQVVAPRRTLATGSSTTTGGYNWGSGRRLGS